MKIKSHTILFYFLILFIYSCKINAGPLVKLCINDNCKKPFNIEISDTCWRNVKALYASTFATDKDEQDNIVNSIALIEADVYHTFIKQTQNINSAEEIHAGNSSKNNYRNIKNYMNALLDNYLVTRHFMRKTIKQNDFFGLGSDVLLLQSLTDSKLYVLEKKSSSLGASPVIKDYNAEPPAIKIDDNTLDGEDFD
ncbi:hypothetical protein MNBD_GAMMA08-2840 [hydrothermal vent metagenome]|uniref:Lipoprotein n=1 Tax=hydrothermal vent metagenome TaxID=652676 RepID=A0A3B0Y7M0_9ZZZZ